MMDPQPISLAIVGGGPRCLYALESLVHARERSQSEASLTITIFDPAVQLGAGTVYRSNQPAYLRMNFPVGAIDAFGNRRDRIGSESPGPSLVDWLEAESGQTRIDPESICSRSVVGRYLHSMTRRVIGHLPTNMDVRHQQTPVQRLVREGGFWTIESGGTTRRFDQVLVVAGHEGFRPAKTSSNPETVASGNGGVPPSTSMPIIAPIYPPERQLSLAAIPQGSEVVIRGFGLTAIDAVLACTEGRGGRFTHGDSGFMRYHDAGTEPARILFQSRTARPMLAKPLASVVRIVADDSIIDAGANRILRWVDDANGIEKMDAILSEVFDTSDALQSVRQHRSDSRGELRRYLSSDFDTGRAFGCIERSIQVAVGNVRPNTLWALGESWRRLYPAIVRVVSHRAWTGQGWSVFQRFAAEMERLSFGPPVENAMRMVALWRFGKLSLDRASRFEVAKAIPDAIADARIPSPHDFRPGGVVAGLVRDGYATTDAHTGSVVIDECGRPLGVPTTHDGLCIVGRCTEGCVLGNDTLGRTMHPQLDHWAEQIWLSANRLEPCVLA